MAESNSIACRPCVKCGEVERYASGACKACMKSRSAAWGKANRDKVRARKAAHYASNPEKMRMYSAAWAKSNPEKIKEAQDKYRAANREKMRAQGRASYAARSEQVKARKAAYRAANPEQIKATLAAWSKSNPESIRIRNQNRRARREQCGGVLSKDLADKLFKLQKGKCACCGKPLGEKFHLDHIMPLALGGTNTDDNMQLLIPKCNIQKHAKHPVDFMQERGFLI